MRLVTLAIASALLASVQAQFMLGGLPECAVGCATTLFPTSPCPSNDYFCLCSDERLLGRLDLCVMGNCTIREALAAKNETLTACRIRSRDESGIIAALAPAMAVISFVFVVIRLIARWKLLDYADLCIGVAWLMGLVLSVINTMMAHHGLGKDLWTVQSPDVNRILFLFYVSEPFYLASTVLCKIGICLFLLKIFPFRNFQIAIWSIVGFSACTGIAFTSTLIAQCSPISYSWLFWDGAHQGRCIDRNAGTWAHACVNIVLDLVILAAPLVQLWTLQTAYSRRKKFQITLMFLTGMIVTIVSILRLRSLIVFMQSHNFTYDNLGCAEWSVVEIHVGIICACLPSARVFFARIVPKLLGVTTNDSRPAEAQYVDPRLHNRQSLPVDGQWNRITTIGNHTHISYQSKDFDNFVRLDDISEARASTSPINGKRKDEV